MAVECDFLHSAYLAGAVVLRLFGTPSFKLRAWLLMAPLAGLPTPVNSIFICRR